jgi:hypothetical protein
MLSLGIDDGRAWIYEIPHAALAAAAGEAVDELRSSLRAHHRDIISAASPRCNDNAANWSYEPDGSLTVHGFRPQLMPKEIDGLTLLSR